MDNLFVLGSSLDTIEAYFLVKALQPSNWSSKLKIASGDTSLIVTQENPGILTKSSYGMTPSWAKQPMKLLYARAEGDKNPGNDPA